MKNKALTYVLLVVVAVIWYQVFFRVKDSLIGNSDSVQIENYGRPKLTPVARDTFQLIADYRDPFGESRMKSEPLLQPGNSNPIERPRITAPKQEQWPAAKYYGIVRKTDSKDPLAILTIDGMQLMVRKGDELFNDIFVSQIWRDSIQLRHKKDRKVILRN